MKVCSILLWKDKMKQIVSAKKLSHKEWLLYRNKGIGGSDVEEYSFMIANVDGVIYEEGGMAIFEAKISKMDVGTESYSEKEKGQASGFYFRRCESVSDGACKRANTNCF